MDRDESWESTSVKWQSQFCDLSHVSGVSVWSNPDKFDHASLQSEGENSVAGKVLVADISENELLEFKNALLRTVEELSTGQQENGRNEGTFDLNHVEVGVGNMTLHFTSTGSSRQDEERLNIIIVEVMRRYGQNGARTGGQQMVVLKNVRKGAVENSMVVQFRRPGQVVTQRDAFTVCMKLFFALLICGYVIHQLHIG